MSFRPCLEALEDRCVPTVLYWHPSSGSNWSTPHNWRSGGYAGLDMGDVPDVTGDVAVFDHADACTLDANETIQEVRFLSSTTTILSIGNYTLEVSAFTFHAGVISFTNTGGTVKYFGAGAGIWDGSADIVGAGTFWLRDGAYLDIQGVGSKSMEALMKISDTAVSLPSTVAVGNIASTDTSYLVLGATGRINVAYSGTLQFDQAGTFIISSGSNSYSIVSDSWAASAGSYSMISANSGTTEINIPIINNDVGAKLYVVDGATLTVDDPGDTRSVYQVDGRTQLDSGCYFNAVDGYVQAGGSLLLTGISDNGNVVTTGDFNISGGIVSLNAGDVAGHVVWTMGNGYVLTLGSSIVIFFHASVTNGTDQIQGSTVNYGGTLRVKSDSSVTTNTVLTLFTATAGTGSFANAYDSWTASTPLLSTDYTIDTSNHDYVITKK